jgi:CMP-2-keto-3-deoxyoctulosonic acid synthetase
MSFPSSTSHSFTVESNDALHKKMTVISNMKTDCPTVPKQKINKKYRHHHNSKTAKMEIFEKD